MNSSLCTIKSQLAPQADGMLSVLAGFSPRVPFDGTARSLGSSGRTTPRGSTPRGRSTWDADLATLDFDPKLATKIMAKRKQAQARSGLFKTGLDIATAGMQVDMKRMAKEREREADKAYHQEVQARAALFDAVDDAVQNRRRQMQKDCVEFSLASLRKESRREYALSDPDQLKRDFPARREGHEVPFSSMQKFEGELATDPEEIKERRKQMSSWLSAQVQVKQDRAERAAEIDRRVDEAYMQSNYLRIACEEAVVQELNEETLETARENRALASARSARRKAAQEKDNTATLEHCANVVEFNLMRERHDFDIGLTGRKRDYKRCSHEEEQGMWDTNAALVQMHADEKKAMAHVDDEYVKIGAAVDQLGEAVEERLADIHLKQRLTLDVDNKRLAKEQRERALKEKAEYHSFACSC